MHTGSVGGNKFIINKSILQSLIIQYTNDKIEVSRLEIENALS